MAKSIRLLGATYPDVPEVDLPLSGGGTARFIERDETALVVTLSWDSGLSMWIPDKTFAEVQSAVLAGRQITAEGPTIYENVTADCIWSDDDQCLYYMVYFIYDGDVTIWKQQVYSLSQNGIALAYEDYIGQPSGTIAITQAGNNNVSGYAIASVPLADWDTGALNAEFTTQSSQRKWRINPNFEVFDAGWMTAGVKQFGWSTYNAVAANTSVSPTESAQTIGGANYMMEGAVTVNAIPSSYVGSGITRRSGSDMTASNLSVTAPAGYYASAGTKTLSDQNLTAENVKKDVTIFGVTGSYEGGGGTGLQVEAGDAEVETASSSIVFEGLLGEPTSFYISSEESLSTGTPARVAAVVFDGQSLHGQTVTSTSNANASYDTGFSKSYSNGDLTITATTAQFQPGWYDIWYTYGGGSIETSDVQVGSGATSISFTGLEDEPAMWSCIFKSNFGTSSGYQRVMATGWITGQDVLGICLDSSAHTSNQYWTSSYSNGTLTITSQGTNAGGYFHQPGYYQLTYATGGEAPPIEVEPLSVTENGTYTAPRGTAYSPVTVNVASGGGASVDTKTVTASNRPSTLSFTSMKGQPKMFALKATFTMTSSSTTYYYVDSMRGYLSNNSYSVEGRLFRMGSTRQTENVASGYSASYSGTTLTLTSTGSRTASPGCYYNGSYELVYVY